MEQIAFLGTGLLGSAFVEAACRRGERVAVWNRTTEKARALEKFGARASPTPAVAVRDAVRVHLVLKDDAVVEQVIADLMPGLSDDAIVVDHSTTQPALTAQRVKRLNEKGVRYIHCPVFIGPAAARKQKGTILCAGPRALFDAIHPALRAMAENVEYLGERPDLAAVYKLCGNAFIIGLNAIVADAYAVGAGAGVDARAVLKVIEMFDPGATIAGRGKLMADGQFNPTFELSMARKDVRLMMETAGDRPLSVLPSLATRMDELIKNGHGEEDLAVLGKPEDLKPKVPTISRRGSS